MTARAVPPPASDPAGPVDRAIALAAFRGERALSIARIVFCAAILARAFSFPADRASPPHAVISIPSMLLAILFSIYMAARGWRRHHASWLLTASTTVDALVCFAALVPNSLWPGSAYGGILRVPDTAALLIITAVSGVRLSATAAAWSAVLNAASLAGLIAIDVARLHIVYPDDAGQLSLFVLYLGAAAAVALIVAIRTRRLVAAGAAQAVIAEQARHKLHALLQDHHDVRTVLASATLNADLAMQSLAGSPEAGNTKDVGERLEQVREDLRQVGRFVTAVKEEAQEELRFQRARVAVDVTAVVVLLLTTLQRQFPHVRMSTDSAVAQPTVVTGGGAETLERILFNLIVNACEGNGTSGAADVQVRIAESDRPGWLRIGVVDNGPGFPAASLPICGERAFTTKASGTGIGLMLTASLIRANGSRLTCGNGFAGGGIAQFELPDARTGPAPDAGGRRGFAR